ncbi:hypothetical protein KRR38_34130 [Novosphingobium sp. G106]|uniref:hypothetical protein n=1 Tax=Novosphingobium sp. G106 TaxID=2849500 RepID=UPI001C2D2EA6|nr:hypothetical protein [Novosphingobium sp. G106]MBV1692538.1 hypothetical protein [Novosphingobium sp. G106]
MNFQTSAKICREREAHHQLIAAEAGLLNVRKIADTAAEAWARQAEEAEAKEAGFRQLLSAEDAAIAREFQQEDNPTPTE